MLLHRHAIVDDGDLIALFRQILLQQFAQAGVVIHDQDVFFFVFHGCTIQNRGALRHVCVALRNTLLHLQAAAKCF